MRRRGLRSLCFLSLLAAVATTARAEFCEDLETILGSAQDGFGAVRGALVTRHQDPLSETRIIRECTLALTGADSCEVVWLRQAFTYNTFWHKSDEEANVETFEALAELLERCGLSREQASKSGRTILFHRQGQANLDVILARNARRVRLSLTTSGFPNP